MRKEIEVKAKIENLSEITEKLKNLGCVIGESIEQDDIIFVNNGYGNFTDFQPKKNILRIRKSGGKILFTLKQSQANELDALEREVEISNVEEMKEILLLLGYHEVVRVKKKRSKTNYHDWEICLDEVEGLGTFIEIEKITEDEDGEKVQKGLFEFLMSLGVRQEDRIIQGYDTLVYLKNKPI